MSLDIYESVFQNTLSGSLKIRETQGFSEYFPLVGGESILIEFSITIDRDEHIFRRLFRIQRIGDQTYPKNEERTYTIDLVTPEFMRSVSSRMTKRIHGVTCLDAALGILVDYLQADQTRVLPKFLEDTAGKIDVVIPNYTPLQAINLLATMALTKDAPYESNFLFYETLEGFHFESVSKLIKDAKKKTERDADLLTYEVNANKLTGAPTIPGQLAFNSIIGLHQEQVFDVLADIAGGMLRTRMLYLDPLARKWNEKDSRYTETFPQTTHLAEFPVYPKNYDQSINRNVRCMVIPTNVHLANSSYAQSVGENTSPLRLHESVALRNRQLKELQHIRTVLDVPGRADLRAGSIINLVYPSSRAIQDASAVAAESSPTGPTPYQSGRHLVTRVRHNLTQVSLGVMEYRMHIEACRDSLGAPMVGYTEDSNDVDSEAS
tara:strand:+ start:7791 stop:9095 length:1305 start_codon:yes stop_codon:yes gene_type:complete